MRIRRSVLFMGAMLSFSCNAFGPVPLPQDPIRSVGTYEIRRLLLDAASSGLMCEHIQDRFIALPEDFVPGSGRPATGGRWHITQCVVTQLGNNIALHLEGQGWTYVDKPRLGFRVGPYVNFDASVDLVASLDVGYDTTFGVASLWFTPTVVNPPRVRPRGVIDVQGDWIGTDLFQWAFPSLVQSQAEIAIAQEGARRFQETASKGFTVTYDLRRAGQVDMAPGLLAKGTTQEHPFPVARWVANERDVLTSGGLHVLGPFGPGSYSLDARLDSGSWVRLGAICKSGFLARFQPYQAGGPALTRPFWTTVLGAPRYVDAITSSCPWYLVLDGATVRTRVGLLVVPLQ